MTTAPRNGRKDPLCSDDDTLRPVRPLLAVVALMLALPAVAAPRLLVRRAIARAEVSPAITD